ncbi:glycosyl hydrolase family 18 protein [Paenibacillus pasadenensis]|nr:glycosyl hydrolase family 18 protein [Paenibacillus pasadenensis]
MASIIVSALFLSTIVPVLPASTVTATANVPIRVDVNSNASYTDSSGAAWSADQAYTSGSWGYYTTYNPITITDAVANTNDQALYKSIRNFNAWGGYKFDVPNGSYSVKLKMVDEWASAAGQRKFDIKIEDVVAASAFDIFSECGGKLKACDRTFNTTVTDGQLQVAFNMASGSLNYATVSAIEITSSSGGNGPAPDTQSPSAPASLAVAGSPTSSSVSLSWNASTDNVGVTGYDVYNGSSLAASVTGTSATITGLNAATAYTFTVKAKDAAGNASAASNSVNATTAAQPSGGGSALVRIDVNGSSSYTDSSGSVWSADKTYASGSWGYYNYITPISFTNAVAGTNDPVLYQKALYFNGGGYKIDLPNGTYQVKLKMVEDWATGANQRKFDIKMEDVVQASSFDIFAQCGKLTACDRTYTTTVSDGQLNLVLTMSSGSANYATVSAIEVSSAQPDTQAPTAPANLAAASPAASNSVTLSWSSSTDNVGVTGYNVYNGSTLAASVTGTTATITGLNAGTAYTFTVKAKDAAGNLSAASNAVQTTTAAPDTQAPSAPSNLAVNGTPAYNSVALTWSAATDNVDVTGYNVYKGSTLAASVTGTSATVTGLTASTAYSFTVKAKDGAGNLSAASNTVNVTTPAQPPQSAGNKIIGYWQAWAIYDSKGFYRLDLIDAAKLTHLNYAFADICWNNYHGNGSNDVSFKTYTTCKDKNGNPITVPNGTLVLGDPYADTQFAYPTNDPSLPFQGAFNQLIQLKKQTGLKSIISVGGWTWSNRFSDMAADPLTRNNFVTSSVQFLRDYQLDGIDIDWEYPVELGLPSNSRRPEDRQNYVLLLQELRAALDTAGQADGKHYTVTIAGGASPSYRNSNDMAGIAQAVDWINIMTYDFHGDWDAKSGHNAPLYYDPADNGVDPQNFYIDAAVMGYLNNGVPANKLVLGLPFYGRGWNCGPNAANNGMYQTCAKADTGTWSDQDAWWDFWDLEQNYLTKDANGNYTGKNGFTRYWNDQTKTPWLYNPTSGLTITYDDPMSLKIKTDYLKSKGLAGAMFWELDADRGKTLITVLSNELPK